MKVIGLIETAAAQAVKRSARKPRTKGNDKNANSKTDI